MTLALLSDEDREVVRSCLHALLAGPWFRDEREFSAVITGSSRARLAQLLASWGEVDDSDDESEEATFVNNGLNLVASGIRFGREEWARWFPSFDQETVRRVFSWWRELRGW